MGALTRRLPQPSDKVLAAAGGFTGLWALTWLGAESAGVSTSIAGGLAVGSVMGASGLTALWWKTRTLRALHAAATEQAALSEAEGEGRDETSSQPSQVD